MQRRRLIGVLGIVLAASSAAPLPIAAADIFQVTEVPVDATAENAVVARQAALDAGQREGLRRLIERLTPEGAAPPADLAGLSIDRYVESFQIASEQVAPTRYLGTLNVTYAPGPVEDLLRRSGRPFVDRRSEPLLIIPVWRDDAGVDPWSETDPWRPAWNAIAEVPTFLDLRLPLGDIGDVTTLTADTLQAGDPEPALVALADRYAAQGTIVAFAGPLAGTDAPPTIAPEPIEPDQEEPVPPVAVELRRADRWDQPFGTETLLAGPEETPDELMARAVRQAILAAEIDWKRRNLVPEDQLGGVRAVVPLVDLAAWVQIRQRLAAIPGVRSVNVESLARDRASVTIAYAGETERLADAIERAGLVLAQENGEWLLRRAGDPLAYPQPPAGSSGLP